MLSSLKVAIIEMKICARDQPFLISRPCFNEPLNDIPKNTTALTSVVRRLLDFNHGGFVLRVLVWTG